MARPRAPDYDATRAQILAAAARLFALKGFAAASMNEVAEACAVTKPTLYHYVRDKQQLLVQICEQRLAELATLVAEVDAAGLGPDAKLRALIERFVAGYGQAQHEHRVLTEDLRFLPEPERERLLALERGVVAAFADALRAVRPELATARLDKPLTMLLFGMINWTFTWLRPDGELSHDAIATIVADLFFGGLHAVATPTKTTA
ncbi:MAG: TetR family transcriptional regulator [Pelomonas sp.]|nr:TetR family transcriptional regulator [Roseateles sp.]